MPRRQRQPQPSYYVVQVDDEGERVLIAGARTLLDAARRAAGLDPDIDGADFVATWNVPRQTGVTT